MPVTMVFRHHASDELIYAEPHPATASNPQALARAAQLDVALLDPMSGISADEPLITSNRIDYHMGLGSTADVLRNVCLVVHQDNPGDWLDITQLRQRLFQVSADSEKVTRSDTKSSPPGSRDGVNSWGRCQPPRGAADGGGGSVG